MVRFGRFSKGTVPCALKTEPNYFKATSATDANNANPADAGWRRNGSNRIFCVHGVLPCVKIKPDHRSGFMTRT